MKPVFTLLLFFLFYLCKIGNAINISEIKFVLTGNDFIWRVTDGFDDAAYYSVTENKYRSIAVKSYNKYIHLESPVKNWGFIVVQENDTIKSFRDKSSINITSQSEKRTNELLFFHRMFSKLGNEKELITVNFIKTHITIQSLIKEVEKRFEAYNAFLDEYKKEYNLSDLFTNYYRDYLKISNFNLRFFISQTNLAKQPNIEFRILLKDSKEIINLNQWDNPQYRRAVINYYKIHQQINKDYQVGDALSLKENSSKLCYDYYSFISLKQKMVENSSVAVKLWNSEKNKVSNVDYYNYMQSLVNGSSINFAESSGFPKSIYSDEIMSTPKLKSSLAKLIENDSADFFLLDFWASWCGPCRHSIPFLKEYATQFKKTKIIYLSIDKNYTAWQHATEAEGLLKDYNFIIPNFDKTKLYKQFKIISVPRYILIDKNGKVLSDNLTTPDSNNFLTELNTLTSGTNNKKNNNKK